MADLESEFHSAMGGIYEKALAETAYRPTRFFHMVGEYGGSEAARRLLQEDAPQSGLTSLWEAGRLDLSVECLVLQPRFRGLFNAGLYQEAQRRLQDLGYSVDESGKLHHTGQPGGN